jgi:thiol-disulfide isomerase/thioredoxin
MKFMMKKTSFGLFGIIVLLLGLAVLPALGYVEAGNKLGDLEFPAPLGAEDASYLGVPAGKPFKLSQLSTPYTLVEVFATGCSHCYAHAPAFNTLFGLINKDPKTAGKVKVIGLASGDSLDNCGAWKKQCKVPFALAADTDRKTTDKINIMGTPTTILLDKAGNVLYAKAGAFESPEAFLKELIAVMK